VLPARALRALALLVALGLAGIALSSASAQAPRQEDPCAEPAGDLLCPDLVMRAPFDLRLDRRTRPGRVLLRAANSIDSLGTGPVEVRGRRIGRTTMSVRQRIHRRGWPPLEIASSGRLAFKRIPGQGGYWKYRHAARFEMWQLDGEGRRERLVREGPKVFYCLRDLVRSRPSGRSPSRRVYPACSQNRGIRAVTLGTSVGWSDVYPASYHEQWVDVTGLRGRFSLVHVADPRDGIAESDESNNAAGTIVRLPSGRAEGRERVETPPEPESGDGGIRY